MKKCQGEISRKLQEMHSFASKAKEQLKIIEHVRDANSKEREIAEYKHFLDNYWTHYRTLIEYGVVEYLQNAEKLMYFIAEQATGDPQILVDFATRFGVSASWSNIQSR